jgi:SAM-dependent methyltransferase
MNDVFQAYKAAAPRLIARFEEISTGQLYEPVIDLLPTEPLRVVDIGAGTGRDADWLAARGHSVFAVEPVDDFRDAGMTRHTSSNITWLDDRLPDLAKTVNQGPFDLLLLSAVWHHLDVDGRRTAMRSLRELTAPGGMIIMSLRHGPGVPGQPVFDVAPEETILAAQDEGFALVRQRQAGSVQAGNQVAGIAWTWLAFALR